MSWRSTFEEAGRCASRYHCPALDHLAEVLGEPGHDEVAWEALAIMSEAGASSQHGPGRFASWAVSRWLEARRAESALDGPRLARLRQGLRDAMEAGPAFRTRAYHLLAGSGAADAAQVLQAEAARDDRDDQERVEAARALGRLQSEPSLFAAWLGSEDPTLQRLAAVMLPEIDFRRAGGVGPYLDLLRAAAGPDLAPLAAHAVLRWLGVIGRGTEADLATALAGHPDQAVAAAAASLAGRLRS